MHFSILKQWVQLDIPSSKYEVIMMIEEKINQRFTYYVYVPGTVAVPTLWHITYFISSPWLRVYRQIYRYIDTACIYSIKHKIIVWLYVSTREKTPFLLYFKLIHNPIVLRNWVQVMTEFLKNKINLLWGLVLYNRNYPKQKKMRETWELPE